MIPVQYICYSMCSVKEFPCSFFACRVGGLGKMGWLLGDEPGPFVVFIELECIILSR